MLGRQPKESVGPDLRLSCRELMSGSVFGFLAERRDELFPEELFADLYPSRNGRPSVPPRVLACATVLQVLEKRTDHDAVAALRCDLCWKAACGRGLYDTAFDPSLFICFRRSLALSGDRDRIFTRVREIITQTGLLEGRR